MRSHRGTESLNRGSYFRQHLYSLLGRGSLPRFQPNPSPAPSLHPRRRVPSSTSAECIACLKSPSSSVGLFLDCSLTHRLPQVAHLGCGSLLKLQPNFSPAPGLHPRPWVLLRLQPKPTPAPSIDFGCWSLLRLSPSRAPSLPPRPRFSTSTSALTEISRRRNL
jgi:hypothetical protein